VDSFPLPIALPPDHERVREATVENAPSKDLAARPAETNADEASTTDADAVAAGAEASDESMLEEPAEEPLLAREVGGPAEPEPGSPINSPRPSRTAAPAPPPSQDDDEGAADDETDGEAAEDSDETANVDS
jgi:hypothetical protein